MKEPTILGQDNKSNSNTRELVAQLSAKQVGSLDSSLVQTIDS